MPVSGLLQMHARGSLQSPAASHFLAGRVFGLLSGRTHSNSYYLGSKACDWVGGDNCPTVEASQWSGGSELLWHLVDYNYYNGGMNLHPP